MTKCIAQNSQLKQSKMIASRQTALRVHLCRPPGHQLTISSGDYGFLLSTNRSFSHQCIRSVFPQIIRYLTFTSHCTNTFPSSQLQNLSYIYTYIIYIHMCISLYHYLYTCTESHVHISHTVAITSNITIRLKHPLLEREGSLFKKLTKLTRLRELRIYSIHEFPSQRYTRSDHFLGERQLVGLPTSCAMSSKDEALFHFKCFILFKLLFKYLSGGWSD